MVDVKNGDMTNDPWGPTFSEVLFIALEELPRNSAVLLILTARVQVAQVAQVNL